MLFKFFVTFPTRRCVSCCSNISRLRFSRFSSESDDNTTFFDYGSYNVVKRINVALPQTQEEAVRILFNWHYVQKDNILKNLRKQMIRYGKLNDHELNQIRSKMDTHYFDAQMNPYIWYQMDPIIRTLITLNDNELSLIKQNAHNPKHYQFIQEMKQDFLRYGELSPFQINFIGRILHHVFGNQFDCNFVPNRKQTQNNRDNSDNSKSQNSKNVVSSGIQLKDNLKKASDSLYTTSALTQDK